MNAPAVKLLVGVCIGLILLMLTSLGVQWRPDEHWTTRMVTTIATVFTIAVAVWQIMRWVWPT